MIWADCPHALSVLHNLCMGSRLTKFLYSCSPPHLTHSFLLLYWWEQNGVTRIACYLLTHKLRREEPPTHTHIYFVLQPLINGSSRSAGISLPRIFPRPLLRFWTRMRDFSLPKEVSFFISERHSIRICPWDPQNPGTQFSLKLASRAIHLSLESCLICHTDFVMKE